MKNCRVIKLIRENIIISIIILLMMVIYGCRMFQNGPWYDELYTYYSFISRGVIYSAIHWPVPNNHVGYSVISSFFNIFGNPYISLRGVSFLASIANIILIYFFAIRFMDRIYGVLVAVLYVGANIVHMLAVQGRGYSLAVTCFLLSGLICHDICKIEESDICKVRSKIAFELIIFALTLTLGLYILPSSIYWVLPICITGGLYLLLEKKIHLLALLIISSLGAAICTLGLYGIIWLAIGSNLLCKNPESKYAGIYQLTIIKKAPIDALKTGIDYMLATPYIQSIERGEVLANLLGYFKDFFNQCYRGCGVVLILVFFAVIAFCLYRIIRAYLTRHSIKDKWIEIYLISMLVFVPFIMILQSVLPYKRVLSFFVVPMALGFLYLLNSILKTKKYLAGFFTMAVIVYTCFLMTTYDYIKPMADRENQIVKVLEKINPKEIDSICYTDDFQKYVLKFYYNLEPKEFDLEEASYVLVNKAMKDKEYESAVWPMLFSYDEKLLDIIEKGFKKVAETEEYQVYCRK